MTNITIKYKKIYLMQYQIGDCAHGCVHICKGRCMSTPEQKIIENDAECPIWLKEKGEPFSVCQFFPKVSQFTPKLCQNFEIFGHFADFSHFCVNISQKCATSKKYVTKIVINRDRLLHFLILSDQKVILCKVFMTYSVSPNHKSVSPLSGFGQLVSPKYKNVSSYF